MNSTVTDDKKAYTYEMPRTELRQMLRKGARHGFCYRCDRWYSRSVGHSCREGCRQMLIDAQQRSAPYHYDLHESRAGFWECAGWTLFAAVSIAVLAVAISWGLK